MGRTAHAQDAQTRRKDTDDPPLNGPPTNAIHHSSPKLKRHTRHTRDRHTTHGHSRSNSVAARDATVTPAKHSQHSTSHRIISARPKTMSQTQRPHNPASHDIGPHHGQPPQPARNKRIRTCTRIRSRTSIHIRTRTHTHTESGLTTATEHKATTASTPERKQPRYWQPQAQSHLRRTPMLAAKTITNTATAL